MDTPEPENPDSEEKTFNPLTDTNPKIDPDNGDKTGDLTN